MMVQSEYKGASNKILHWDKVRTSVMVSTISFSVSYDNVQDLYQLIAKPADPAVPSLVRCPRPGPLNPVRCFDTAPELVPEVLCVMHPVVATFLAQ